MLKNNIVSSVTGVVYTQPITVNIPDKALCFEVSVLRKSGQRDLVTIVTTDFNQNINKGDCIRVSGFLYTFQAPPDEYPRFRVCLYSLGIVKTNFATNKNVIIFKGTVVKQPQFRLTPSGIRICELLIAVNNDIDGLCASYIPCIVWNQDAETAKDYKVGTFIYGVGRLQSREYRKIVDGLEKIYTTHELSINNCNILEEEDGTERL